MIKTRPSSPGIRMLLFFTKGLRIRGSRFFYESEPYNPDIANVFIGQVLSKLGDRASKRYAMNVADSEQTSRPMNW